MTMAKDEVETYYPDSLLWFIAGTINVMNEEGTKELLSKLVDLDQRNTFHLEKLRSKC